MTITPPGHRRWIVRCLAAALWCSAATTVAPAQDMLGTDRPAILRGQSPFGPIGYDRYGRSLPPETSSLPFTHQTSPWIEVSQESALPPQRYASGAPMITQAPLDPFGQPYDGGQPIYGDPGLGGFYGNSYAVWQPYVAVQGKAGTEASGGFGQLMMPLYQDGQTLFFADIRGRVDDGSNTEGNLGLAVRSMIDPTWLAGLYAFYDYKHTQYGNSFNQGTIGIEAMSVQYEARLNGYFAESGAKHADSLSTAEFDSGTIFVNGGFERAYSGVDGEIGALLWDDGNEYGTHEFRGFLGGYVFGAGGGFPTVAGPKGRLEFRAYDIPWFGPESRLTFGVEMQYDDVRDFQIAGLARLEIPLGVFTPARKLSRLERRMLDRIVRDDDIVTVAEQGDREIGIDSLTKRKLTGVTLLTAADDVPAGVAAAGANSTVVVDGGGGEINNSVVSIKVLENQVFRGGGFKVIGSETGAIATFGTRPTIVNTDLTLATVLMTKDKSVVADLNLIGGKFGIAGATAAGVLEDRNGILVARNAVTNAKEGGFVFRELDNKSSIQNNVADANGRDANGVEIFDNADGFRFGATFHGTLKENIAKNNTRHGMRFIGSVATDGKVASNLAEGNEDGGIRIDNNLVGSFTGNVARRNGLDTNGVVASVNAHGFQFGDNVAADNVSGTVSGNTADQNGGNGFLFSSNVTAAAKIQDNKSSNNGFNDDGIIGNAAADGYEFGTTMAATTFLRNSATDNAQHGFNFEGNMGGKIGNGKTADQNIATGNGGFGFRFAGLITGVGSTINLNGSAYNQGGGFFLNNITGGAAGGTVTGNTAYFNGLSADNATTNADANGFSIVNNNGTFKSNTAWGNANNGFARGIDDQINNNNGAIFNENIAYRNGDAGFRLLNKTGATFNKNQAIENVGAGYTVTRQAGDTAVGNTGRDNASDNTPPP